MEYVVRAHFDDGPREWRTAVAIEAHEIAAAYEDMGATSVVITAPNGNIYSVRDLQRGIESGVLTDA